MFSRILMGGAFALLVTSAAGAHDRWANNEPVPSWVKAVCCGPTDVHHLRPEQVHLSSEGWRVDGFPDLIPIDTATPSPDGDYWIFYRQFPDGDTSKVYCFFTPFNGT